MSTTTEPGALRRLWTHPNTPSTKYSFWVLPLCFFTGIIFWGGFNTGMEMTNRLEFCTTCHEMHDTVYQEYK